MSDLHTLSVEEAARLLAAKEISSRELTEACLVEIDRTDDEIGSFLEVTADLARGQAELADARLAAGKDLAPLTGVPIALKDLFITEGVRTTCASKILHNYVPAYQGTVAGRLAEAGAVLLGKTNMDEFAMGSSCENSALGRTTNPWNTAYVPGGSSGGSASVVAARQALGSYGTDTGGSIRLPASFCGVVGLKPTYGRVSRYGVIAFASSLDQVGPFATTVRGAAALLAAVAGHDPRDSTSIDAPVPDYGVGLDGDLKGVRVGVPIEYFIDGLAPDVEARVREALATLQELGAEIVDVTLPHTGYAVATYYIVATAEASSNLGRYDGVRFGLRTGEEKGLAGMYGRSRGDGFGDEVKRRIMLGTYALSAGYYDAYYLKAMKVRTLIRQDFTQAFEKCDVIASPTGATTAFRLGERTGDPLAMYLTDVLTISTNLAGLPGMSQPCGFDAAGMPVGLQLIGKPLDEQTLFRVGAAFEDATDFHTKIPTAVAA